MKIERRRIGTSLIGALLVLSIPAGLRAQESQEEARPADQEAEAASLAKAAQNPIGNLISVPFQNNTSFQIGPFNRTSNVLNIQPVIPVELSGSILLINRTILPVVSSPDVTRPNGTTWGLGDLNYTAFFTPADAGPVMVGAGPVLLFPTGTSDDTGSGKWAAGPSVVLVATPGSTLIGLLVNNVWSYAGSSDRDDLNQMLIQYFVNYNFPGGWYLSSAPIITSDWTKPAREGWIVPFGGGGGKIFKIGRQPINGSVQAFYNVVTPEGEDGNRIGPEWSLRLQLQLLFPK
jgi:hypothetical protein